MKKQIAEWKRLHPQGPFGFAFTCKQIRSGNESSS
jgi:hypothetical protein